MEQEVEKTKPQQIDIGKVIAGKFRRKLPRLLVKQVEKLICQDEINYVLREYGHLEGIDFADKLIAYFGLTLDLFGKERLPNNPRAIFICNHPLGALDGICLTSLIANHYGTEIRYIVNDMLLNLAPFRKIFVPVNTLAAQSRESVRRLDEVLVSPYPILTFPAGICSRLIDGKIQDPPWKKSFVSQALRHDRAIVPLYFNGRNSRFFYRIEQLRKALGLKFNIGTALLPREMFKAKGSHFSVTVGNPILPEQLKASGLNTRQLVQQMRDSVYRLSEELNCKTR